MRRLACIFVLAFAGCDKDGGARTPGEPALCTKNADCESGFVCKSDGCRKLCTGDTECPTGEICEDNTFCRVGERDLSPRITGINGLGSSDDTAGHTTQHVVRRMVILGANLAGATARLTRGAESYDLTVCESHNDGMEVELPEAISEGGAYTLTVATQAGSCAAELSVLQGEPGAAGADGAQGIQGEIGPTGDPGYDVLALVEPELVDCSNGGWILHTGTDADRDNTLDAEEYTQTVRICHGLNGADGAQGPAGSPDSASDILAKLNTLTPPLQNLDADKVDGKSYGQFNDPTLDIRAYINQQLCEIQDGTYSTTTGMCDPNMVVGSGSGAAATCPAGYPRVCTPAEVMRRAPLLPATFVENYYWVNQDPENLPPGSRTGNMADGGDRDAFPDCNGSGWAPMTFVGRRVAGARNNVREVICVATSASFTPLCCR